MKKLVNSIIITLISCILILFLKNQFSSILLISSTYGMPALIKQGKVDNLYIGSSMFRQGLDIITLENAMPDRNYILAYNGNQPALEYYELSNLLNNNLKISHLYIDMYVYSAWEAPEISDEKLFLEIGLKEKWDLWNLIHNESQTNFESFFRMFVSSNNELLLTWPLSSPLINNQFYKGGTLISSPSADADTLTHTTAPIIDPDINKTQEYYLCQMIQLAREHNISVTFIETPKYSVVASNDSYLSAMNTYIQLADQENVSYFISENTAKFVENNVSDSNCYFFDHENTDYFMDSIHLSYEGRITFTEIISQLLSE